MLIESCCSRVFNLGDEAILSCNLQLLKREEKYDLVVLSPSPKKTSKVHNVSCKPNFYRLIGGWTRVRGPLKTSWLAFRLLFNARRIKKGKTVMLLDSKELDFLQAFFYCDVFLVVGGGILNSSAPWFSADASGLFPKGVEIVLARIFGKPVLLGAQTVGPFEKWKWTTMWTGLFARLILNRVDFLTLREHFSKNVVRDIGVKVGVKVVPDDSFNVSPVDRELALKLLLKENLDIKKIMASGKVVVGVSLRAWGMVSKRKKLRAKLLRVIKALSQKEGFYFVFIPTFCSIHLPCIVRVAEKIVTGAIGKRNCKFLRYCYDWREIKRIFGLMDIVIAVSFHSAVFSISMNVPTVGLYESEYYRMKMQGFFDLVGLPEFALDVSNVSAGEIESKINMLFENRNEIREFLVKKCERMQRNSCAAVKQLIKRMDND